MFTKCVAAASVGLLLVAQVAEAHVPPPPPPPAPPVVHAAPPSTPGQPNSVSAAGHGVPLGIIVAGACIAGTVLSAIIISIRYGTEASGPGLCGLGMQPATCDDMRNGTYAPGPAGETPDMVKRQRLAEHGCLTRVAVAPVYVPPPPRPKRHVVCIKGGTFANRGCTYY